jgi:hypothetical protein
MFISDEAMRAAEFIRQQGQIHDCSKRAKWVVLRYILRIAAGKPVSLLEFREEFLQAQAESRDEAPPSSC